MKRSNAVLIIIATVIVIIGGLAALRFRDSPSAPEPSDVGGAFQLVDQNGMPANESRLKGKWTAVFFGYTFCPDVCPTTLTNLGQAANDLGPKSNRFQVIFVTVDPRRDTPAQLKRYLSSPSFPSHVIGLTGTDAEIAAIARAYHVYYRKAGDGPDYSMDHSSIVYLMDPEGHFVKPLNFEAAPAAVAGQILSAMASE